MSEPVAATISEQATPATIMPTCPRCGRGGAVRYAGWKGDKLRIRAFHCLRKFDGCGFWFLDPKRPFAPPGPRPDLRQRPRILQLRKNGWTFAEIGTRLGLTASRTRALAVYRAPVPSDGRFEIRISPKMLPALRGLFRDRMRRECRSVAQMCEFLSERIESDAASYALAHVTIPPHGRNRPPKPGLSRQGLSDYAIVAIEDK